MAPQKDELPKPVLMWILAMKGNLSALSTMVPLTILYWILQQTLFSFSLHCKLFNFEFRASQGRERDGMDLSFLSSSKNSGQFSLCLQRHPTSQPPEKRVKSGCQAVCKSPPSAIFSFLQQTLFSSLLQTRFLNFETNLSHSAE